jgi:hypothetical protein
MSKVVVVGGGFAGSAAALSAAKTGADVTLLERTDMLLGCALEAGCINGNGTFTFIEEAKAMGGGDIFHMLESIMLFNVSWYPEWKRSYIYNLDLSEPTLRRLLEKAGVTIQFKTRAVSVKKKGNKLQSVIAEKYRSGQETFGGDAFVDCSGTGGGVPICNKYGRGCVMCMLRCPAFGDRVSIATEAGAKELMCARPDGTPGLVSSAICISKESASPELRAKLEKEGVAHIPLPPELVDEKKGIVLTNPNMPKGYISTLHICNVGSRYKLLGQPYFPLEQLRKVPGLENARLVNWGSSEWNGIRYVSMAPRDNALRVEGLTNLFCAGEKSGPVMGNDGAIVTGVVAGHNAARIAMRKEALVLPRTVSIGDFIAYVGEKMKEKDGLAHGGYSSQGGPYFERMEKAGLYTLDVTEIKKRVKENGLENIFGVKL